MSFETPSRIQPLQCITHSSHIMVHDMYPGIYDRLLQLGISETRPPAPPNLLVIGWHPSSHLPELMNPSVTVINSLPALQLDLSGPDIWEWQQEWWRHEFQIWQNGSDDETSAQILSFTLPDLIYSWWGETQCNLHVISSTLVCHTKEKENLEITLMQPAADETESNDLTLGQVKEVHSFCVSPAPWFLATDATTRSTEWLMPEPQSSWLKEKK